MAPETSREAPARLYVLLARKAPIAVVFRRGPTKWTELIQWRTDTDTFAEGHSFHGRSYARRCGPSPATPTARTEHHRESERQRGRLPCLVTAYATGRMDPNPGRLLSPALAWAQ